MGTWNWKLKIGVGAYVEKPFVRIHVINANTRELKDHQNWRVGAYLDTVVHTHTCTCSLSHVNCYYLDHLCMDMLCPSTW